MLAQNFKTAADLGITDEQHAALRKVLTLAETGKLTHAPLPRYCSLENTDPKFDGQFNMLMWSVASECGTVMCLGGTAEAVGQTSFDGWNDNWMLARLFRPTIPTGTWRDVTPDQAATALRSYLTTGDARWYLAVAA